MKANELRIGNYLMRNEKVFQVVVIDATETSSFTNAEPIPLTEEWLIRLGAMPRFERTEFIYDRFRLIWKKEYNYWRVIDCDSLCYISKVEFVHEWQNVVFVLNGKEVLCNSK